VISMVVQALTSGLSNDGLIDLGARITLLKCGAGQTDRYCFILEGAKYNTTMVSIDVDEQQ